MKETELFEALGEQGLRALVAEFYRQIPSDDLLGPMYPADDLAGAEERLANFLIFRFGGPEIYIEERGHPRLRMRHAPFAVTGKARARWMKLMENAIDKTEPGPEASQCLREFLGQVATFLVNR